MTVEKNKNNPLKYEIVLPLTIIDSALFQALKKCNLIVHLFDQLLCRHVCLSAGNLFRNFILFTSEKIYFLMTQTFQ